MAELDPTIDSAQEPPESTPMVGVQPRGDGGGRVRARGSWGSRGGGLRDGRTHKRGCVAQFHGRYQGTMCKRTYRIYINCKLITKLAMDNG